MGESFGRYSKYIIRDRAIPDARDGFKSVKEEYYIQCIKNVKSGNNSQWMLV